MDWWLIFLRIVHVGSAMAWFGGAIVGGFFLLPRRGRWARPASHSWIS